MKQGSCIRSVSEWREVDFAHNCTHVVHDQPSEPGFHLPRAMTSIPHNLTFQYDSDNEVSYFPSESRPFSSSGFPPELFCESVTRVLVVKPVNFFLETPQSSEPPGSWTAPKVSPCAA
ncbi:hypothetical protein Q7C36_016999 [Tachysurus vachellii]|uniref:Uncharacterized protein n=1 Tax=Tachysurus vachellii TaxID=175792 RepID=A0AA88M2J5_TACVA|nr:hypothetical protein Q7C36_016999 [Tachysurus vachellii]